MAMNKFDPAGMLFLAGSDILWGAGYLTVTKKTLIQE